MNKRILKVAMVLLLLFTSVPFFPKALASSQAFAGKIATESTSLNVRKSPSSSSAVITSLKKSSWVTLTKQSGSWWYVEYGDGKFGWCHGDYIKKYSKSYPVTVNTKTDTLNVRSGAGTSYSVKDRLSKGEDAVVISVSGDWARILYRGNKTGYSHKSYLKKATASSGSVTLNVPSYKQTDSRWAAYPIGTTGGTIGTIGCTTTALAMTESYHTGKTIIPKAMAQRLSYSASGSLYWPSDYSVEYASSDYLSRIYTLLKQGKPVVLGAKKANGTQHWVTVTGYSGSTGAFSKAGFTINDPGSGTRKTVADFLAAYPTVYKIVYKK